MASGVAPAGGPVFPVSVKGVVIRDGMVLLARNDRQEWELPGGRLEIGETPPECVAREIAEETGWPVKVHDLLDVWVYQPLPAALPDRRVLILTYGCTTMTTAEAECSPEHDAVTLWPVDLLTELVLPEGYRQSIKTWRMRLAQGTA